MRRWRRWAVAGLVAQACIGPGYRAHDGVLTHASGAFSLPDLSLSGWERVRVKDADLAFRDASGQTIAVRASCRGSPPRSLEWAARDRFVGTGLETQRPIRRLVSGHPAIEVAARGEGLRVRAVLIWTGRCLLDLAYAAPVGLPGRQAPTRGESFEKFVAGLRAPPSLPELP